MRSIFGALFIALGLFASTAFAQVTGRVEVIGFDGNYRPACWTPMIVWLNPNGAPTGFYELRVWQHDLDGDLPYFSTRISLTAAAGEQPFWTYFIPESIREGLTSGNSTPAELAQRLRITIHDANGKELSQIPIGNTSMTSVEPPLARGGTPPRATRLVLMVGTAAMPALRDYDAERIVGIKEDLLAPRIKPERLPENALGYDGVDAVVWLEGDPATLSASGGLRFDALREYVRAGGHLVICTPPQWQQVQGFDDLLPVDITGTELNTRQSPLREIAARIPYPDEPKGLPEVDPWERYRTTQTIAVATPRPGAVVDEYSDRVENPEKPEDRTPWLVRRSYGFGCVTWVAQDLGSRELLERANWGWPAVWEAVLGANSAPLVDPKPSEKRRFEARGIRDVGYTVLEGMNLSGRGATLVSVTVLFFIGYWLLAGPGMFFWLKYKNRATLSWFAFGAVAVGATIVTLGVVRLVLRGSAEMKHVSLARIDGDRSKPADIASRFGVYVPRDGAMRIEIPATAGTDSPPTLTPFPIHPAIHRRLEGDKYLYAAPRDYRVNVPTDETARTTFAEVPFRTTMKRLEAQWTGTTEDRIEGNATLQTSSGNVGYISGTLRNLTGKDLRNVYIAFRHEPPGGRPRDWMMFVYAWKAGDALDLGKAFNPPTGKLPIDITVNLDKRIGPNREYPVRGWFNQWLELFSPALEPSTMGDASPVSDLETDVPTSVPLLSFFNRFPVLENTGSSTGGRSVRAELHRSGLREWDMSNALMAGKLVVVAQANQSAVPLAMTIEGEPLNGPGRTIYQFILPLAPIPEPPATRPATTQASN